MFVLTPKADLGWAFYSLIGRFSSGNKMFLGDIYLVFIFYVALLEELLLLSDESGSSAINYFNFNEF